MTGTPLVKPTLRPRKPAALWRFAMLALVLTTVGCKSMPPEVNLWPIAQFSRDDAGSYRESRFVGPLIRIRKDDNDRDWAVHPIVRSRTPESGYNNTLILWPISEYRSDERGSWFHILPLLLRRTQETLKGTERSLLIFPILYTATSPYFGKSFMLFPFFGKVHQVLGRDEIRFFLFPLWMESTLGKRRTWNFLWPFFGGAHGPGSGAWRFFPFWGRKWKDGVYDRKSILWPFFHFQRNHLDTKRPLRMFLFFPFYGQSKGPGSDQRTFLWPFFGTSSDRVAGTRVTSVPWPILQWAETPQWKRFRFWPFYGRYDSDELKSRFYAWPLVWTRKETVPKYEKESLTVFPFYRNRRRTSTDGEDRWHQLLIWPFYRQETSSDGQVAVRAPALNPFPEFKKIDDLYSPVWELYHRRGTSAKGEAEAVLGAVRHRWTPDEETFSVPWVYASHKTSDGKRDRWFLQGLVRVTADGDKTVLRILSLPVLKW